MSEAGDFENLVRACQGELFAVALARCGNRESAKDVLQEVLVSVWEHRQTVFSLTEADRRRYLFAMTRNRAIDFARRAAREQKKLAGVWPAEDTVTRESLEDDRLGILEQCLACLDAEDREWLMLSTMAELDGPTIAERVGAGASTVRSRLSRIRRRLRDCVTSRMERGKCAG